MPHYTDEDLTKFTGYIGSEAHYFAAPVVLTMKKLLEDLREARGQLRGTGSLNPGAEGEASMWQEKVKDLKTTIRSAYDTLTAPLEKALTAPSEDTSASEVRHQKVLDILWRALR